VRGKIDMAARRQVTNKLRGAYARASKSERGEILTKVQETTGVSRSTARRLLTGPVLPAPKDQVDRRSLKPRGYSDDSRALLRHVWALMGFPCGKYLTVMLELWMPLLAQAGDLDQPFATPKARAELESMSPATIDRYLAPERARMELKGIGATKPSPLLRNSIKVRKVGDEHDGLPGLIEADTVAHCGPTLIGEFARTLTMTDVVTGWTECASIRNNASKWIVGAVAELRQRFPFPITHFVSDNGSEFINHQVANWLQASDIAQLRSRPHKKNDQATVESKNNHVVRKHAFYWRYDTPKELTLLGELWALVSLRLNFFTPTKKPIRYDITATGRRRRAYDKPQTPWQRVKALGVLTTEQTSTIQTRIQGVNPADLTRRITTIQAQLTDLARGKTTALADARHLDMTPLEPSIRRLATTR
jgi:hypothetical protein